MQSKYLVFLYKTAMVVFESNNLEAAEMFTRRRYLDQLMNGEEEFDRFEIVEVPKKKGVVC